MIRAVIGLGRTYGLESGLNAIIMVWENQEKRSFGCFVHVASNVK